MASGKAFKLTERRREIVLKGLRRHKTLSLIHADSFTDISYNTFRRKVAEAGIDIKHEHAIALNGLRAATLASIHNLDGKDQVDSALRYLARYEKTDDTIVDTTVDVTVDIKQSIIDELND